MTCHRCHDDCTHIYYIYTDITLFFVALICHIRYIYVYFILFVFGVYCRLQFSCYSSLFSLLELDVVVVFSLLIFVVISTDVENNTCDMAWISLTMNECMSTYTHNNGQRLSRRQQQKLFKSLCGKRIRDFFFTFMPLLLHHHHHHHLIVTSFSPSILNCTLVRRVFISSLSLSLCVSLFLYFYCIYLRVYLYNSFYCLLLFGLASNRITIKFIHDLLLLFLLTALAFSFFLLSSLVSFPNGI